VIASCGKAYGNSPDGKGVSKRARMRVELRDHAEAARPCEVGDRVEKRARTSRRNVVNNHEKVDLQVVKPQTRKKERHSNRCLEEIGVLRGFDYAASRYWDQFNGIVRSMVRALERGWGGGR
jgi:hypothetical protein